MECVREHPEPGVGVDPLPRPSYGVRQRRAGGPVEPVAAGDRVGLDPPGGAVRVGERHGGPLALEVVQGYVGDVVVGGAVRGLAGVHQVPGDLGLAVDPHRPADVVDEVEVVPLTVAPRFLGPLQVDAAVLVALAREPVAEADLGEQVDRRRLQHAGADPAQHVVGRPVLHQHRLDPGPVQQVGEQQSRRARADDEDLGALRSRLLGHGCSSPSGCGTGRTRCRPRRAAAAAGTGASPCRG